MSAGTPPTSPVAIPPGVPKLPSVPGIPKLPPPTPTAPALPGAAPSGPVTFKFNITNGAKLVPAGIVGVAALFFVIDGLGGGKAPTPAFMGKPQTLNDVGASKIAAKLMVQSITVG